MQMIRPSRPIDGGSLQVLTLGLEDEIFALETEVVREVLDSAVLTEVPGCRPFVRGLINVRGKVVPVVDLKSKFRMGRNTASADQRIVVIETEVKGESSMVGLLADRVHEVTELAPSTLEEAPIIGMRWRSEFIQAIGKRGEEFIIVMDIARVFASEEAAFQRSEAKT